MISSLPRFTLLEEAALGYARRGWRVFPLAPGRKVPLIRKEQGGHGCHDGTTNLEQVTHWWRATPRANIGIATGRASNLFVLDIDPDHDGPASFAALEDQFERLPQTFTVRTGSGGLHLYYCFPQDIPAGATLTISQGLHGLFRGLDSRGEGGYVAAPPSVHPSGALYEVADPRHPAEMPPWLVMLLIRMPVVVARPTTHSRPVVLPRSNRPLIDTIVERTVQLAGEGSRNWHGYVLSRILHDKGISRSEAEAALRHYARRVGAGSHPYTEAEALRTLGNVYGKKN